MVSGGVVTRVVSERLPMQPAHRFRLPKVLARRGGSVGRPPANIRPKFTPEQIEVATQVMMFSKIVMNWVASESEFLGVDLNSVEGRKFFLKNSREAALRLIK